MLTKIMLARGMAADSLARFTTLLVSVCSRASKAFDEAQQRCLLRVLKAYANLCADVGR